jgi:hypothetical protein
MKIVIVCLISLHMLVAVSAAAADLDGFRGFVWGDSLEKMRTTDPKLVEGHMGAMPGVKAFRRTDEELTFGGIQADGITYIFYKDRFSSVSIDFRGFDNYEKLLIYCKKKFGPSTGSAVLRLEQYASFDSPKTSAMLLYQLSMQTLNYGRLYLYSKDSSNRQ